MNQTIDSGKDISEKTHIWSIPFVRIKALRSQSQIVVSDWCQRNLGRFGGALIFGSISLTAFWNPQVPCSFPLWHGDAPKATGCQSGSSGQSKASGDRADDGTRDPMGVSERAMEWWESCWLVGWSAGLRLVDVLMLVEVSFSSARWRWKHLRTDGHI